MSVSAGDSITAANFNALQSRVEQVLGDGSGNFGYGQTVTSLQVAAPSSAGAGDGDTVTSDQIVDLRTDMNRCWRHQTGEAVPLALIGEGDVIGADDTGSGITYEAGTDNYTITGQDNTGGFNDYLSKMDEIELNRFDIDPGESTTEARASEERTSTWNGAIDCVFRVTFTSADARRHYFNSGGQISFGAVGSNGTGSKSSDWSTIITNPGLIQFGHNYVSNSGSSTGVTLTQIGNYQVTSSYQTIFEKQGSAAVYAENRYRVEVIQINSTTLDFRITFADNDAGDQQGIEPAPFGPAEDEDVDLDIEVTCYSRRASGSFVSVSHPSVAVTNSL